MLPPNDKTNADQQATLLDLVRDEGGEGLGAVMLRLAHMAAAQHRANKRPKRVKPWSDEMETVELSLVKDAPRNGFPAMTRSAPRNVPRMDSGKDLQGSGPVTTEGDR